MAIVGAEYCDPEERVLTVRKTSHFSPGDGFAAYDHRTGGLAFRADTYGRGHGGGAASAGELALLGPAGEPLLTVRRRRPSLHHRWEGFLGARADGQKALFTARRPSILGGAAAGAVRAPPAGAGRRTRAAPRGRVLPAPVLPRGGGAQGRGREGQGGGGDQAEGGRGRARCHGPRRVRPAGQPRLRRGVCHGDRARARPDRRRRARRRGWNGPHRRQDLVTYLPMIDIPMGLSLSHRFLVLLCIDCRACDPVSFSFAHELCSRELAMQYSVHARLLRYLSPSR